MPMNGRKISSILCLNPGRMKNNLAVFEENFIKVYNSPYIDI